MDWNQLASEEVLTALTGELQKRNINLKIVNTKEEALGELTEMIPADSSVMNGSSTTLNEIGMVEVLQSESKWKNLHTPIFQEQDPDKQNDIYRAALLADYYMASPNAITKDGRLVFVDKTGSRTGAIPFAAKHLLLVAGTNKIVENLDAAFKRIEEHVFPLENERSKAAYGRESGFGKWVILDQELDPQRTTLILVRETLGF